MSPYALCPRTRRWWPVAAIHAEFIWDHQLGSTRFYVVEWVGLDRRGRAYHPDCVAEENMRDCEELIIEFHTRINPGWLNLDIDELMNITRDEFQIDL